MNSKKIIRELITAAALQAREAGARLLGISRISLWRKMKALGLL